MPLLTAIANTASWLQVPWSLAAVLSATYVCPALRGPGGHWSPGQVRTAQAGQLHRAGRVLGAAPLCAGSTGPHPHACCGEPVDQGGLRTYSVATHTCRCASCWRLWSEPPSWPASPLTCAFGQGVPLASQPQGTCSSVRVSGCWDRGGSQPHRNASRPATTSRHGHPRDCQPWQKKRMLTGVKRDVPHAASPRSRP